MPEWSEIWAAMHEPLFWGMHALSLVVVILIGFAWAAAVWGVTQGVKARIGWRKPYTRAQFHALAWTPILVSGLLAIGAFPAAVEGVGGTPPSGWWAFLAGVVGGFGAKGAHDLTRSTLEHAGRWIRKRLGLTDSD